MVNQSCFGQSVRVRSGKDSVPVSAKPILRRGPRPIFRQRQRGNVAQGGRRQGCSIFADILT